MKRRQKFGDLDKTLPRNDKGWVRESDIPEAAREELLRDFFGCGPIFEDGARGVYIWDIAHLLDRELIATVH